MTTNRFILTLIAASVLGFNQAGSAQESKETSDHELRSLNAGHPSRVSEQELKKKVTKVNKASTFIGMKVKNLQDQDLGTVEDLAFDGESGKIAYAVLSVGGFLGLNEKNIAVPINALTPAPGDDHLLLDADKKRLESAAGFPKDRWPDLDTPAWGAASGFASNRNREADRNAIGRPAREAQQQGTSTEHSDRKRYFGSVTEVDPAAKTLTVKGVSGDKQFTLDEKANVTVAGRQDARIDEIKTSMRVSVEYAQEGEKAVAHAVHDQAAPAVAGEDKDQE